MGPPAPSQPPVRAGVLAHRCRLLPGSAARPPPVPRAPPQPQGRAWFVWPWGRGGLRGGGAVCWAAAIAGRGGCLGCAKGGRGWSQNPLAGGRAGGRAGRGAGERGAHRPAPQALRTCCRGTWCRAPSCGRRPRPSPSPQTARHPAPTLGRARRSARWRPPPARARGRGGSRRATRAGGRRGR
jgi:hypothetical protein